MKIRKIKSKRQELANLLSQINAPNDVPYFSIDYINKYVLGNQDLERIDNIKKVLRTINELPDQTN